jgi:hypothetical protein
MNLEDYISKYASLKTLKKAFNIATKRGSLQRGSAEGLIAASPLAVFAGSTITTLPPALQQGSLAAAAGIMGMGGAVGAVGRTARNTQSILSRARRLTK